MRMEQIARRRRTVRARWLFLHTHGAHPYTPLSEMRGAQFFSIRMEHIAKSLPGPIRAPLSLHIQSHSKRSLLGCVVVLHIIIWNYSKQSFVSWKMVKQFQWFCHSMRLFHPIAWWKYSLFLQFSPWRNLWLRHFSGYSFETSRKKASTIFRTQPIHNISIWWGNRRQFLEIFGDNMFTSDALKRGCVIENGWCFFFEVPKG